MIYHIYPNNKSNLLIIRHINRYVIVICDVKLRKECNLLEMSVG